MVHVEIHNYTARGRYEAIGYEFALTFEELSGSCPDEWYRTKRALLQYDGGRWTIEHAGYSLV